MEKIGPGPGAGRHRTLAGPGPGVRGRSADGAGLAGEPDLGPAAVVDGAEPVEVGPALVVGVLVQVAVEPAVGEPAEVDPAAGGEEVGEALPGGGRTGAGPRTGRTDVVTPSRPQVLGRVGNGVPGRPSVPSRPPVRPGTTSPDGRRPPVLAFTGSNGGCCSARTAGAS